MIQMQNGQNGCDSRHRQMILSRRRLMKMSHRLRRRRVRHHERWCCVVLSLMEVVHYAPMLMMLDVVENSMRLLVDEGPSQFALSPQANENMTPDLQERHWGYRRWRYVCTGCLVHSSRRLGRRKHWWSSRWRE